MLDLNPIRMEMMVNIYHRRLYKLHKFVDTVSAYRKLTRTLTHDIAPFDLLFDRIRSMLSPWEACTTRGTKKRFTE